MDSLEPLLVPVIAAFVVGGLIGSWGERWLLWRRLSDARWVYRRLAWTTGKHDRKATEQAAQFAATACVLQLGHPLLVVLWIAREHRWTIALLAVAAIGAAGLALMTR